MLEPLLFLEQSSQIADTKGREPGDVAAFDLDRERLGSEASPVTSRAGQKPPEAAYKQALLEPVCAAFETAKERLQAVKSGVGRALDEELDLAGAEARDRDVDGNAEFRGNGD